MTSLIERIHLDSNENPLGPSLNVQQAIYDACVDIHHYPDHLYHELQQAIASSLGLTASQITLGNGSENILELIIKAHLTATTNAIVTKHIFLTIPRLIEDYGKLITVENAPDFQTNLAGILTAVTNATRLIFLVNPNNPTSTFIPLSSLLHFLRQVPTHIMVVLDEAYYEYMTKSDYPKGHTFLNDFPNLIVTRTFSKAYGLASLRIGYALSSVAISAKINQIRVPYNVNKIAVKAAIVALNDQAHLEMTRTHNQQGLAQLKAGLTQLQLSFLPTNGNFITVKVGDGEAIAAILATDGILVRALDEYGLPEYIRVTVGTDSQIAIFLQKLGKICA